MSPEELAGWLRLALTPGVGDQGGRRLLAAFGLPEAVFAQSRAALRQVVSEAQAEALLQPPPALAALQAQTWEWLQAGEADGITHHLVTLGDAGYPRSLLDIADPPLMLYVLGHADFDLNQLAQAIAIVGSRNPTPQGARDAQAFARAFGEAGLTVVSGLALGIDGAAHEGALEAAQGPRLATVAVVGTGLDRVYPARHRALAHRIAMRGLLVSEFPLGTPPLAPNFPQRNRLIAGLSRGTLVVEAAPASGSLITARLAGEQGKEVFAIPGSIHAPQSRGCHQLIRQGAKLVESVQDVLEELRLAETPALATADAPAPAADEAGGQASPQDRPGGLLAAIGFDPVSLDALVMRTGYGVAELQARLLELELDGRVARLPGGLYQRLARG